MTSQTRERRRVGTKVPINVYEGDRPVCQCHTALDAKRIVDAVNAEAASRSTRERIAAQTEPETTAPLTAEEFYDQVWEGDNACDLFPSSIFEQACKFAEAYHQAASAGLQSMLDHYAETEHKLNLEIEGLRQRAEKAEAALAALKVMCTDKCYSALAGKE